eukprot:TRINITY_DN2735_c0_g1_i1.p1 TRINITY_DN2735_c0_g1~~TRINITY_DN2735_c0_g1_i1.p1  ORF type:complete len:308 (+),score=57.18 TRINITY_DN2735_c0_g1_i1:152-1075(+)
MAVIQKQNPLRVSTLPFLGGMLFLTNSKLWGRVILSFLVLFVVICVSWLFCLQVLFTPQARLFKIIYGIETDWILFFTSFFLINGEIFIIGWIVTEFILIPIKFRIYKKVFLIFTSEENINEGMIVSNENEESQHLMSNQASDTPSFGILNYNKTLKFSWSKESCKTGTYQKLIILGILLGTFPLNFLPYVGNILYLVVNAFTFGWSGQSNYLNQLGITLKEQILFTRTRWKEFFLFGLVSLLLDLIPVIGIVFLFTNNVGSAIWAFEMEKNHVLDIYVNNKTQEIFEDEIGEEEEEDEEDWLDLDL